MSTKIAGASLPEFDPEKIPILDSIWLKKIIRQITKSTTQVSGTKDGVPLGTPMEINGIGEPGSQGWGAPSREMGLSLEISLEVFHAILAA